MTHVVKSLDPRGWSKRTPKLNWLKRLLAKWHKKK